jgi:hypothetical protein
MFKTNHDLIIRAIGEDGKETELRFGSAGIGNFCELEKRRLPVRWKRKGWDMVNRMAIGAATMALLFVGPAFAQSPQWAQPPQWGGVRTQANPYSSMPVYQAPPAPQTWTGTDLGAGISVWNGPNGRSMNCTRIGALVTCN